MNTVSLADAKARLSELIARLAEEGEVIITRHGRPVARLSPVDQSKHRLRSRAAFRAKLPSSSVSSLEILLQLRDEQR